MSLPIIQDFGWFALKLESGGHEGDYVSEFLVSCHVCCILLRGRVTGEFQFGEDVGVVVGGCGLLGCEVCFCKFGEDVGVVVGCWGVWCVFVNLGVVGLCGEVCFCKFGCCCGLLDCEVCFCKFEVTWENDFLYQLILTTLNLAFHTR